MKNARLSLEDLRQWVLNDEGLYCWCIAEEGGYNGSQVRRFVRRNRVALETYVNGQIHAPPRRS